jgi:hypothetical protein
MLLFKWPAGSSIGIRPIIIDECQDIDDPTRFKSTLIPSVFN